jgi:hypothetical protein
MLDRVGNALRRLYEPEAETAKRMVRVPDSIQAKLAHLDELASSSRFTRADAGERLTEERRRLRDDTAALEQLRADKEDERRRYWRPKRDPEDAEFADFMNPKRSPLSIPTLEARITSATTAIERLVARHAEALERSDACGRLATACADWAKTRDPEALAGALARAGDALPDRRRMDARRLSDELAKVRATLQAITAERAAVTAAGVPLEVAHERMCAYVDSIAAGYVPDAAIFVQHDCDPVRQPTYYFAGAVPQDEDPIGMRAFVVALLADQIKARLVPVLERAVERHALLITPAERTQRLEQLDAKAYEAGLLEEWLIVQHEAAGLAVVRREEADPACVLCAL